MENGTECISDELMEYIVNWAQNYLREHDSDLEFYLKKDEIVIIIIKLPIENTVDVVLTKEDIFNLVEAVYDENKEQMCELLYKHGDMTLNLFESIANIVSECLPDNLHEEFWNCFELKKDIKDNI